MYACTRSASSAAKTEQGSKQKAHVTYLNSVCSFICAKVRIFIPRIGAISPHVLSISGIFMLYYVVDCEFVPCMRVPELGAVQQKKKIFFFMPGFCCCNKNLVFFSPHRSRFSTTYPWVDIYACKVG